MVQGVGSVPDGASQVVIRQVLVLLASRDWPRFAVLYVEMLQFGTLGQVYEYSKTSYQDLHVGRSLEVVVIDDWMLKRIGTAESDLASVARV